MDSYELEIAETATSEYQKTYTVAQEVGEKAAASEVPFDLEKAFYTSFNLKLDGQVLKDGETLNFDIDNGSDPDVVNGPNKRIKADLTIEDILPESSVYFDSIDMVLTGTTNTGYVLQGGWSDYSYASCSFWGGEGSLVIKYAGTYTLTVTSTNCKYTYTFVVSEQAPATIGSEIFDGTGSGFVTADSYDMFVSNTLYIKANIGEKFTQTYAAALAEGTENATLVEATAAGEACYKFNATQPGTYKVVLIGAIPDCEGGVAATKEVTIVVKEIPDVSNILSGDKQTTINGTKYSVVFTKEAETDLSGTVTITNTADSKSEVISFAYDATENAITCNHVSGDELGYSLVLSSKYALQLVDGNDNKYEVVESTPDSGETVRLDGKYTAPIMNGMFKYVAEFTATTDTTGTLVAKMEGNSEKTGTYAYVVNADGTVTLELTDGTDVVGNYPLSYVDGVLKVTAFGKDVEFTKEETPVTVHENFLGTWTSNFGSITFEADKTTNLYIDGFSYNVVSCDATTLVLADTTDPSYKLTYTYDATANTISDGNGVVYTKEVSSVTIHENFLGTWTSNFGSVTFEASVVENLYIDGFSYNVVSCDATTLVLADTTDPGYKLTYTYDASTNTISDMNNTVYEKQSGSTDTPSVEIHKNFIGTWLSSFGDKIIVEEGKLTVVAEGTTLEVYGCDESTLILTNGYYTYYYTYNASTNTISDRNGTVYEKQSGSIDTPSIEIHENFLGTWTNDFGETFVISESSVTFEGDALEMVSCDETTLVVKDFMGEMTLAYNADGTITGPNEAIFTKQGGSSEDTPSVEIHENFIGTWTCDNGSIKIAADTTEIQLGRNTLTIVNCDETLLVCAVNGDTSNRFSFLYTAATNQLTDSDGNQYTKGEDSSSESVSFSGKYTASFPFMGSNMTFEATFEGNNVTVCIPESSSKSGNYSYEVGSDGTITLTFIEGTDTAGKHKLFI